MNNDEKLDQLQRTLDGYIEFSTERFTALEDKVDGLEIKLENYARDQRSIKLELLDKLASKDKVNAHELRLQALEAKVRI